MGGVAAGGYNTVVAHFPEDLEFIYVTSTVKLLDVATPFSPKPVIP